MKVNDEEEFRRSISKGITLVDFYADWCPPCRMLSPIIEKIEAKKIVSVIKVNVEELKKIAAEYNIFSIPTLIIFKDGKEVDRIVGLTYEDEIVRRIERAKL